MSSVDIPSAWLKPQKRPGEWQFQCSTDLPNLVKKHQATSYFRRLVDLIEFQHQIYDFHLKLIHNFSGNNHLNIIIYFNHPTRTVNPLPTPICMSCEPAHELSSASLLSEQQHTRTWLDARARSKLIVTPIRHIERLSELIDEDGEMEAFWQDTIDLIEREVGHLNERYPNIVINHGTYRNHAHLHLKINFVDHIWKSTIVPRYQEKIEKIKELKQDTTIEADCFGRNQNKKIKK